MVLCVILRHGLKSDTLDIPARFLPSVDVRVCGNPLGGGHNAMAHARWVVTVEFSFEDVLDATKMGLTPEFVMFMENTVEVDESLQVNLIVHFNF